MYNISLKFWRCLSFSHSDDSFSRSTSWFADSFQSTSQSLAWVCIISVNDGWWILVLFETILLMWYYSLRATFSAQHFVFKIMFLYLFFTQTVFVKVRTIYCRRKNNWVKETIHRLEIFAPRFKFVHSANSGLSFCCKQRGSKYKLDPIKTIKYYSYGQILTKKRFFIQMTIV